MKTNPDAEREDELLDAVLRDENWQAGNAAFKSAALGRFQAHQRARRVMRWTGGLAGLAVVAAVAVAVHWSGKPVALQPQETEMKNKTPKVQLQAGRQSSDGQQRSAPLPSPLPTPSSRGEGEDRVAGARSMASTITHPGGTSVKYMTDEELLSAFPKGSCFLAEVDGKKELVFLDPEVAKASMAGAELTGIRGRAQAE